jgi:hypothetical protein
MNDPRTHQSRTRSVVACEQRTLAGVRHRHQSSSSIQRPDRSSRRHAPRPRRCADPCELRATTDQTPILDVQRAAHPPRQHAASGRRKTASMPSPVCFRTCPPLACTADASNSSWRASAARIASGCSSHRRVDVARSVNRNVTVPLGNSDIARLPRQRVAVQESRRSSWPVSPNRA